MTNALWTLIMSQLSTPLMTAAVLIFGFSVAAIVVATIIKSFNSNSKE